MYRHTLATHMDLSPDSEVWSRGKEIKPPVTDQGSRIFGTDRS